MPKRFVLTTLPVLFAFFALEVLLLPAVLAAEAPLDEVPFDEALLGSLEWREVGPYRGGRSAAVAGVPSQSEVYYFGAAGGGVWKTTDAGRGWDNVSDGFFGGSIGAVAVSEWDPNVVYVGGGEKTVRGNVSHGDGVWKTTDAGKTWTHMGLSDTRRIPRIRIHPRDPDLVYVAALGHLFGPNEERGVFRSRDGGVHWENVLFVSPEAGAVDLVMDPTNPRILYASFWRVLRTPYSLESGGEGSGIHKSTDGGDTWKELSTKVGFPAAPLGISGITVSPSNPENLYAIIEAAEGGVFRSQDGGETWERVNEERSLRQRAWYYTRIYADPIDEEVVYVLNVRFYRSKDGGKNFTSISVPHGDNHDLWIDPGDPKRMIQANDGGANVSTDGGLGWSTQANQPTAQMYRVSTDSSFPYRLLGGQQDNSAVRIRSRSADRSSISTRDWEPTAGGESGHIVAKPDDPEIVYGGSYGGYLGRLNHRTGERRAVNVWPDDPMGWGAAELKFRFQWNFPLFFSPHNAEVLYSAANVLFKSRDAGQSWQQISPDLTRDEKARQGASGGPITKDNTSVEYYATIFAALESPHEEGVLWVGSDDGLVHISRDGGENWQNVTPKALPEWSQINGIEAHPFEKGGLYVAATRYKSDDFKPYLLKTTDYGASWTAITGGIDPNHFTRAIRADPDRRGLLYAGTERGVYVSFDDGGHWQSLQRNLPVVPVTDLAVKEKDLVVATQGRGYWILDDLTPLHQLEAKIAASTFHLFTPRSAYRLRGGRSEDPGDQGTNPPAGVVLSYWLKETPAEDVKVELDLFEEDGTLIRTFTRKPEPGSREDKDDAREDYEEDPRQVEAEAGMNRFVWDLNYPAVKGFPGMVLWNRGLPGPRAIPGTYRARVTVGEESAEVPFEVLADPRTSAQAEDFRAQFDFMRQVGDKLSEAHAAIGRLREVQEQLKGLEERLKENSSAEPVVTAAGDLLKGLEEVEKALYQTQNRSRQDPLNFPVRLNDKLAGLLGLANIGDFGPTEAMRTARDVLVAAIDIELGKLNALWERELPEFNRLARQHEVAVVLLPPS
jgi:photosystem II stability/assembly factor-like uncharacterized protein